MADGTIKDTEMVLVTLHPDGPVDGAPRWSVVSGNSTLHSDPSGPGWDPSLPEGHQMYLVSETLAADVDGPVDTEYLVEADVDKGAGIELVSESLLLHVINRATTLGVSMNMAVPKP
jgi:hypothetical protein